MEGTTKNINAEEMENVAMENETMKEEVAEEKTGTADSSKKKGKEEDDGNYVHKFKKPVEIMGKKYSSLTFYFNKMTGEDIEAIEDELMDQNKYFLTPETSSAYQCILAAKAAGVASDEIRRLPAHDYMKIKNKARNFLINGG